MEQKPQPRPLMTPGEVADKFRVDAKTVTRWAEKGLIRAIRTPGGHNRFFEEEIHALLEGKDPNSVEDLPASEHWQGSV